MLWLNALVDSTSVAKCVSKCSWTIPSRKEQVFNLCILGLEKWNITFNTDVFEHSWRVTFNFVLCVCVFLIVYTLMYPKQTLFKKIVLPFIFFMLPAFHTTNFALSLILIDYLSFIAIKSNCCGLFLSPYNQPTLQ